MVYNDVNVGFAAAREPGYLKLLASGEWVLTLNPDVLLLKNFIKELAGRGSGGCRRVGTVCGKLLTIRASFDLAGYAVAVGFDGHLLLPRCFATWIVAARKSSNGHYLNHEYVFGATAAGGAVPVRQDDR